MTITSKGVPMQLVGVAPSGVTEYVIVTALGVRFVYVSVMFVALAVVLSGPAETLP